MTGMWSWQHEPVLLPNGNMLLFDNQGAGGGRSKVIEFNPMTQTIEWFYAGDTEGGFFSEALGSVQRLPNGNTLITDSETGEAFEVTTDKVVVWRYRTPYRAGEDRALIATLAEVVRLDAERISNWLPRGTREDFPRRRIDAQWVPDSRELFFQTTDGPTTTVMMVENDTESTFSPGNPVRCV